MAFPFIFESNFETGDASEWTSETDTASQLDFPHYTELARFKKAVPFDGAFAMRAQLVGGTADAFVLQEDMNIAADAVTFAKFPIWFSPDFTGTADDTFALFEFQGAANAIQISMGARIVATTNVINLGIGELAPTSFGAAIERGVWYTVELSITLDDGASDDGTIDIYVTRAGDTEAAAVYATQVASLDQIAATHGVLGIQDHLATTTGTILYGGLVQDDARVFPTTRYRTAPQFSKSGHAFVGPGSIEAASIITEGATDVVKVWDTDTGDIDRTLEPIIELNGGNLLSFSGPRKFTKGCFVELDAGSDPKAQVFLVQGNHHPGHFGPRHHSDPAVRALGIAPRHRGG